MKASSLLVAAALLLPAAGAFAQSSLTTASRQQGGSGTFPTPSATASPVRYTRSLAGGGSITYFGTVCSHDAQHAQFAQLRQVFESSQPTVVFFENPDCGVDSTEAATISRVGQAGYARYLAGQHQVPVARLDDPLAEYAYLQTKLDPERLKVYYLLHISQQFRTRTGANKTLMVKAMRQFIANSRHFAPGTEQAIHNLAEFEVAYQKYCPAGSKWWQAPTAWFSPAAPAPSADNQFLQDVRTAVGEFRERYTYRKLTDLAQAGQRVLVVLDRDHMPAPATSLASK
ncbi:hypothetical protein GO988_01530 [Hymenobacter sp. HMF4947]|uniref:Uncharacterized protein n=1 Tax=Hymenobacter ginkgonis TaxID=2682976 RepID=A0A7K1T9C5_9BACT|nr:hypothetical protein [Hymenobacter ginkgonis]MVN75000.1 hypothetical protein [Hymenobacter ginkgonis]